MARIRTIKPEFWVSEQVAECSTNARLTFVGMWNFCDDRGVHPAKPKTLKAELFPMDDVTAEQVGQWVDELIRVGLLVEFAAQEDGARYWHVTGWHHQRIERPSFKHPAPPGRDSMTPHRTIADDSSIPHRAPPPGMEGSGKEGSGRDSDSPKARRDAPTRSRRTTMPKDFAVSDRVKAWAAEHGHADLSQHLEAFTAKCAAKGYAYVDWDAAFMEAIRENWAKLPTAGAVGRPVLHADELFTGAAR